MNHADQQRIWDEEHARPTVLLPMDSDQPSGVIPPFYEFIQTLPEADSYRQGLEVGCGKGRNVNWLAAQGLDVTGLDFSPTAIAEATRRAAAQQLSSARFIEHDLINPLPFGDASMDFAIDCYASTDIEDPAVRRRARDEIVRVLRTSGLYLLCVMSENSDPHKLMAAKNPGPEPGSFYHPTNGKFEKAFSQAELDRDFIGAEFEVLQRTVYERVTELDGATYDTEQYALILQKR